MHTKKDRISISRPLRIRIGNCSNKMSDLKLRMFNMGVFLFYKLGILARDPLLLKTLKFHKKKGVILRGSLYQ